MLFDRRQPYAPGDPGGYISEDEMRRAGVLQRRPLAPRPERAAGPRLVPADVSLYEPATGEPPHKRAVSAGWLRRELLAAAVTMVPAAGLAVLPALASDADAELLDLERQLESLLPPLATAHDAHSESHLRAMDMLPLRPVELQYSAADWQLGLTPPGHGFWNRYEVKDRRAKGPLSAEAEARLDEVLAAERRREQVWRDVADASGWTEAGSQEERLWERVDAICARAREIEPQTIEGMAIKARFIAFEAWHLLFKEPEADRDWEPRVVSGSSLP